MLESDAADTSLYDSFMDVQPAGTQSRQVALIGAGPIGIEVAVALQAAGLDYVHFDAGQIGQTICSFPPQTRFFSSNERIAIAGVPLQTSDQSKCTRESYLAYLRAVVQQFNLDIRTYERVEMIDRLASGFHIRTRALSGLAADWHVQNIILATGGTARPRQLGVPGEQLPHVHHELQETHFYFRRRVLIVGGRNSAIEAAVRLYHAGAQVAISYRRSAFDRDHIKYWLLPEITGLITSRHIEAYLNTSVQWITPLAVALKRLGSDTHVEVPADFILLQIGYHADMSLFRMCGAQLDAQEAPLHNPRTMETPVPGVYVAGTATAGTQQSYNVFLENCHVHAKRIVASLRGEHLEAGTEGSFARPET
jgi:thioredoxin reductase (NADPH)